jgi:predicted phage tail protein
MKTLLAVLTALALLAIAGCATVTTTDPATGVQTTTVDVSQGKLAVATHADLQAAAARATANGYPSRATLWLAEDAKLNAIEAQISACANSIRADLNQGPNDAGKFAGPFDAEEALTEKVGNFTGPSAKTKILCKPMPVVLLPIVPKP